MKILLLCSLIFIFSSCSTCNCKRKSESNVQVTKELKGNRYGNIYFSGQPDDQALKNLGKNGFTTVINLRGKKEGSYNESKEKSLVEASGLKYYNVPFSMQKDITNSYIQSVTKKVLEHRKEGKVLIHCSSGNRVAAWLGAHFYKDHGYSKDKSTKMAKKLGLTNPKAEKKLMDYLNTH